MKKILFLVRLPPPMTGAAKMNHLYLNSELINSKFIIKHIKLNAYTTLEKSLKNKFLSFCNFFIVLFKLTFNLFFYKPNIVYFEMAPTGIAFYRDSIYLWVLKLFKKQVFCHFHARGFNIKRMNELKLSYHIKLFKNIKIILLSESLYYDVSNFIEKQNVTFLPNGIVDEISNINFKKHINKKNKPIINLVYLSNMIESKGPLDVLKICLDLKNKNINFTCNFIGQWDSVEFKQKWYNFLKINKLEKNCFYLGPKYGRQKIELLLKSNFLIFPSKYSLECYPLVILESFMCGVPVLTFNTGAIKNIVKNKNLGFVSKSNNYNEITNYILNFIENDIESDYWFIRNHFLKNHLLEFSEKKLIKIFLKNKH